MSLHFGRGYITTDGDDFKDFGYIIESKDTVEMQVDQVENKITWRLIARGNH